MKKVKIGKEEYELEDDVACLIWVIQELVGEFRKMRLKP